MTDARMRYKLVPSKGTPAWYAQGLYEARIAAHASYAKTGEPVLICQAPPGGTVWAVETIGGPKRKIRR